MTFPLAVLALTLLAAAPPPSGLASFSHAWSGIASYSVKLTMHETAGGAVQDRSYDYSFTKPSSATIVITSGPGRGGRAVWSSGDSVLGSPPGLLHGVKLRLSIHDGRVTTLRGDTIDMASFGWLLSHLESTKGRLSEAPASPLDGVPVTELTLRVADPVANGGIGEERVLLSNASGLPLRVRRYAGASLVKEVDYGMVSLH